MRLRVQDEVAPGAGELGRPRRDHPEVEAKAGEVAQVVRSGHVERLDQIQIILEQVHAPVGDGAEVIVAEIDDPRNAGRVVVGRHQARPLGKSAVVMPGTRFFKTDAARVRCAGQ